MYLTTRKMAAPLRSRLKPLSCDSIVRLVCLLGHSPVKR